MEQGLGFVGVGVGLVKSEGSRNVVRVAPMQMAHHVEFKTTRKHTHRRPKKSRMSDKVRTPPKYPVDILATATDLPPVYTVQKKAE
mmetsp:Transcript_7749/g.14070  ORF Transcript_7749/g.14070 Transcript_7749/m.14070 type:complete len:86 (+) Transcript_7749:63-320(+)|eukprot:CAMPEP_0182445438 /NCGR_PEP_ID=MMETSP1172-20130603/3560_1 /TAXON_ID=708627 /ORGANISM="Timspurckia oligopyrenoides, Strain CCMP3278" /LENGTH=85 /DNA_ID=CAMNT_0024641211 /DNA_START=49 /DNA_END=306 /DNA_ORIENTATION=+